MTEGPWSVNSYGEVIGPDGKTVSANGFSSITSPGRYQDEAKANARVAACGPEFLLLARKIASLNPNAGEIGDGMLAQIVAESRRLVEKATA